LGGYLFWRWSSESLGVLGDGEEVLSGVEILCDFGLRWGVNDEGGREEERFPRRGFTEPPMFRLASVDDGGFIGFLWRVRIC
jgi:hypothetical protein